MTVFLILFTLIGCGPSCEKVCDKLLACDEVETPLLSTEECNNSCRAQEQLDAEWDDIQKRDAFEDLKECIVDNECADVADGVCYDEDLYIW